MRIRQRFPILCLIMLIFAEFNLLNHYFRNQLVSKVRGGAGRNIRRDFSLGDRRGLSQDIPGVFPHLHLPEYRVVKSLYNNFRAFSFHTVEGLHAC